MLERCMKCGKIFWPWTKGTMILNTKSNTYSKIHFECIEKMNLYTGMQMILFKTGVSIPAI